MPRTSRPRAPGGGGSCAGRRPGAARRGRSCTSPVPSSITTSSRTCARHVARGARASSRRAAAARTAPSRDRRSGLGTLEVAARADDAVEVVAELDVASEHALVHASGRPARRARSRRAAVASRGRGTCAASGRRRRSRARSTAAPSPSWPTISSSRSTTTSPASSIVRNSASFKPPAVAHERLEREPQRRLLANRAARADRGWTAVAPRPSAGRTPRRRCARPTPRAAAAPRRSEP